MTLFLLPSQASAQNSLQELFGMRLTLAGIDEVLATVSLNASDEPMLRPFGITRQGLESKFTLRLREAGMRVTPGRSGSPKAFVVLALKAVPNRDLKLYAITFNLDVYQPATVDRDQRLKSSYSTWSNDSATLAGQERVEFAINHNLDLLVDLLLNDWLAANPRR
jgi:hypothetical protein